MGTSSVPQNNAFTFGDSLGLVALILTILGFALIWPLWLRASFLLIGAVLICIFVDRSHFTYKWRRWAKIATAFAIVAVIFSVAAAQFFPWAVQIGKQNISVAEHKQEQAPAKMTGGRLAGSSQVQPQHTRGRPLAAMEPHRPATRSTVPIQINGAVSQGGSGNCQANSIGGGATVENSCNSAPPTLAMTVQQQSKVITDLDGRFTNTDVSIATNGTGDELWDFAKNLGGALSEAKFNLTDLSRPAIAMPHSICPHPKGLLITTGRSVRVAANAIADSLANAGIVDVKPMVCEVPWPYWDRRIDIIVSPR